MFDLDYKYLGHEFSLFCIQLRVYYDFAQINRKMRQNSNMKMNQ